MLTPHCNKHRKRSNTQNEKKRNNHFNVYKFDLFIDTVRSFFSHSFFALSLSLSLLPLPFLFGFQSHIGLKNVHTFNTCEHTHITRKFVRAIRSTNDVCMRRLSNKRNKKEVQKLKMTVVFTRICM